MRILCVTARPEAFVDFAAALRRRGVLVDTADNAASALALVQTAPPTLCLVDDNLPDSTPFALVARLMRQNAMIHTAVVSELSPEDFHEAGEGLGILAALPPRPGPDEAERLLAMLGALG